MEALASTTTIHYCLLTDAGLKANEDNGVLGLFGTGQEPRTSYGIGDKEAKKIRNGEIVKLGNISFAAIDIVLNQFSTDVILEKLENLKH